MKIDITIFDQTIGDLLASQHALLMEYQNEKVWNANGISLQRRIQEDSLSSQKVDEIISADNLEKYVVPASIQAPTRCIDGRITSGWQMPGSEEVRKLGPKIAGGTAHAALTNRIVNVGNVDHELLFEEDIRSVIKTYKEIGIGFGGHIDDHQEGSNTGCGAVDNINLILERLQRPEPQEQLRGLTRVVLGDAYDDTIVNEVIGRILYIDAIKPRYMPKENDDPHNEFLYKRTIVETIRSQAEQNEEPVPALTGIHSEIAAVLNFVPNTTIDTDRFSYDNDNLIQVFGWDVWEMYEEARYLYPYNMYENVALQRTAIENRIKHITTRTLLGLATTMVLTDGTLKLVTIRQQK